MTTPSHKLFAVYLGGRAPKCNIELHDVAFVVGEEIEDTYEQLLDLWFGTPERLHLDSWFEMKVVDGYRISLQPEPFEGDTQLFFVNCGGYRPESFMEFHETGFLVADSVRGAKDAARAKLLKGMDSVHTDDAFDIDDCIAISQVGGLHVHLTKTHEPDEMLLSNGLHIIPKQRMLAWIEQRDRSRAS